MCFSFPSFQREQVVDFSNICIHLLTRCSGLKCWISGLLQPFFSWSWFKVFPNVGDLRWGGLGVTSVSVLRSDLVPVYSFGENDAYKQVIFKEGSYWRIWQKRLQKLLGFAPCLFHGCGLFFSSSWGIVPFCKPITTIGEFGLKSFLSCGRLALEFRRELFKAVVFSLLVGEPITVPKIEDPTEEMVDLYHEMYTKALQDLFDKYKTRFGLKESDVLHIQWKAEGAFCAAPSSDWICFLSPVSFTQSAQLCMLHSLYLCLAKLSCPLAAVGSCYIISRVRTRCLFLLALSQFRGWRSPVTWKLGPKNFFLISPETFWDPRHFPRAPTMQPFVQADQKPKETLNQRPPPPHWQGGLRWGCTPVM